MATAENAAPPAAPAPSSPERLLAGSNDPKLIALRGELGIQSDRAAAQEKRAHFRPLCDADGYPLVGNMMTKGPAGVQPSAFCADLRAMAGGK